VRHAYIYYRIDPAQAALAATRIDALLDALTPYCKHPPRRLQRCDDPATWMEIYDGITDFAAFSAALDAALQTHDCMAAIVGERHLECFSSRVHEA
jgi:hypothetical protein